MYRTSILLVLAIAACGGTVDPQPNDVPSSAPAVEQLPAPAACVPLEQHCTVGGKDDTYGNIWRYRADCTVEYGGCLGATPTCSNGACVAPPTTDCPLAGHVVTCVDAHNALLCMGGGRTPDLGVLTPMPCVGTMQCVWPNGNEGTCTGQ